MIWPIIALLAVAAMIAMQVVFRKRIAALSRRHEEQIRKLEAAQEEQAEKTRAQQTALLNSMTEGLLVLDEHNRILLTNRSLEELFQITQSARGKTILEAIRLHTLNDIAERLQSERQILGMELELPGLQSGCLQVNAAAILDDDNQRLGSVLVFHDLTRLKELENTRQEFVANVSHELRTPLSMIKGFAETLLSGAKDDPAVCERFLQTIEKHADRLAMLIDDLLTISRLEGGRVVLNVQPVPVQEVVASVFDDLQTQAATRQVTLDAADMSPELTAAADPDRLKQILWNLVENGIKYGKPGGRVRVAARVAAQNKLQISVADDGPGIPEQALPRVFERFYRVDKARSRDAGGTGLGLAIVKHLVQSHGGEVWAESKLGQGSTFFFTLPSGQ